MAEQQIQIKNLNQGGIADSDYLGSPNSVSEIVGINIHDESGILKLNQRLAEVDDAASAVDSFIKAIVPCSDGHTYFFSSTNGKIWKRTTSGTWTLEATAAPAAGSAGISSAMEYSGYIYYAMENRLGRWQIGTAWSTRNDSWATFLNGEATHHPMHIVNLVLYIGDRNVVAQVDAHVFSNNALDLDNPHRVTAIGNLGTDLLIGTYISANVIESEIFRWNTWSDSFSVQDVIPEVGINAFLAADNRIIVSAGTKGNLYIYNGQQLEAYKQIKGVWGASGNKAIVHANAKLNFHGLPLFGFSKQSGDGVSLGVYSFGRTNANYPFVLALEYPISTGQLTGLEIGAISGNGDSFYVSWKQEGDATTYGVDYLDLNNKYATGYYTSRLSLFDRVVQTTYGDVIVPYRSMPSGTSVTVAASKTHGAFVDQPLTLDEDRKQYETDADIGDASTLQVRTTLVGSANNSPEVEMTSIEIQ